MGQNAVGQSNCRILKEEVNDEVYFWHAEKQQNFL